MDDIHTYRCELCGRRLMMGLELNIDTGHGWTAYIHTEDQETQWAGHIHLIVTGKISGSFSIVGTTNDEVIKQLSDVYHVFDTVMLSPYARAISSVVMSSTPNKQQVAIGKG